MKNSNMTNSNTTKNSKESVSHKVGDKVEHAGDKISQKGANKLGNAVHNAGDKIEHMNDNKRGSKS